MAHFDPKAPFSCDHFMKEKYRVVAVAEVEVEKNWDEKDFKHMVNVMKKCIPTHSSSPPTLWDRPGSSWAPALGRNGCQIGLYTTSEEDVERGELVTRWYLVCHTSLPEQTLTAMQKYDESVARDNLEALGHFAALEEGLSPQYKGGGGSSRRALRSFAACFRRRA